MSKIIRSYSELVQLETFEDRYEYLKLNGVVGESTFGYERWSNQNFYRSREWRHARRDVIARDLGCDLGIPGFEIHQRILVHHMNPLTVGEIERGDESILDPNFLITVTHNTHLAIHFGDNRMLPQPFVERRPGDTIPWRR